MFVLVRNGRLFDPEDTGRRDILVCAGTIVSVDEEITSPSGMHTEELDADGRFITPGFVDIHVHLTGGGGEGGPETRVPEIQPEALAREGITTVVGLLGTDDVTRHPETLLAKTLGLQRIGFTAFMMTGSYQFPPVTVTGSVRKDLALIPPIIGVGEIALSDHRSSQPTFDEFLRLVAETRVGGLLGGKRGLVQVHMGGGERGMEYIFRMGRETELPLTQVLPTHCGRSEDLLQQALCLAEAGGNVDVTASGDLTGKRSGAARLMEILLERGVSLERMTVSSDAGGSIPRFDSLGNYVGISVADTARMQTEFRRLREDEGHDPGDVLPLFTRNPAVRIGMGHRKGAIRPGMDADLVIYDDSWNVSEVLCAGVSVYNADLTGDRPPGGD